MTKRKNPDDDFIDDLAAQRRQRQRDQDACAQLLARYHGSVAS